MDGVIIQGNSATNCKKGMVINGVEYKSDDKVEIIGGKIYCNGVFVDDLYKNGGQDFTA